MIGPAVASSRCLVFLVGAAHDYLERLIRQRPLQRLRFIPRRPHPDVVLLISHEDIDTQADPAIVPFVAAAVAQAMRWYDAEKLGASRLAIGNAIRSMCRAKKSREGDHFGAAIGLRAQLEDFVPTIPDWANDQHTLAGRKLGRGLDHFRKEGAKLVPPPTADDPYEDEAYRLWAIKQRSK
jgi:hypothetical protein